jgi:hypothetical protein
MIGALGLRIAEGGIGFLASLLAVADELEP